MKMFDKTWKKIAAIVITVLVVMIAGMLIYLIPYYKAVDVDDYMSSTSTVDVKKIKEGYYFDGPGQEEAIVFYPGAKVDAKAYSPILKKLAENGVDSFLVEMPFHMAFLGINKADRIISEYEYDSWYMAGHSLGGAMAAQYLSMKDNASSYKGIIFLASYSASKLTDTSLSVLSIYGSNDGVLKIDKVKECRANVPSSGYKECEIKGGNHALFGSYGKQKGDNTAEIDGEEQWNETVDLIIDYIK